MGIETGIAWTDHTFNPWIGCTKVSDGCKFCYAEALMDKRWGKVKWGPGGTRVRTSPANWREPIKWDKAAKAAGVRRRVFCASLADVFEGRPELDEWLVDLLLLIDDTPNLDWQLLTKRPENVPVLMPTSFQNYPRPHLWIGTSVENQATADERIPKLVAMKWPAVRFVSYEPALGPVRFGGGHLYGHDGFCHDFGCSGKHPCIDWIIVGGESGQNARPFETAWARSVVQECAAAKVPVFVKQMGSAPFASDWDGCSPPMRLKDRSGADIAEFPADLRVRQMPAPAKGAR